MPVVRLGLFPRQFSGVRRRNIFLGFVSCRHTPGLPSQEQRWGLRGYSNVPVVAKPGLWSKLKDGVVHYWQGSKLLAYETKISFRLLRKVLNGEKLIRREYRQLLRTTSDLFRLVPFIIIAVVPFLEFALPIILKFFPNMLPSTFEDKLQAEEKIKKQLKVKLETAKFLQDMTEQMSEGRSLGAVKDLKQLFEKTRTLGVNLTAEEVVAISRQLGDEITLENLTRPQLSSLCRYMSLKSIGTDNFLRYQLRRALQRLKRDDEMISDEGGVDSLTLEEVKTACHARGIRTIGVSERYMRSELSQWIDLHVKHDIPVPLLILSRAFALSEKINMEDALKAAVVSLPDSVFSEAEAQAAAAGTESETKLRIIKEQERLITEELEQERPLAESLPPDGGTALNNEQLHAINEAVVTLASKDHASIEKRQLSELKEDKAEFNQEHPLLIDDTARKIETQVDRLIQNIDKEIVNFESELSKRLQHILSTDGDTITTDQLAALIKVGEHSPQDFEKIHAAIKTFDADGDGKLFLREISAIARDALEREDEGPRDLK